MLEVKSQKTKNTQNVSIKVIQELIEEKVAMIIQR